MENTVQRLEAEMERRRSAEAIATSIDAADEIMQQQAEKDPKLAAKQLRLLTMLRMNSK